MVHGTEIPTRLDDPPRFLWWDLDVGLLFMSFLVLGLVLKWVVTLTVVGFGIAYLYNKTKVGQHTAFGMHLLYWHLPITLGFKATPPSAIREFIG